MRVKVCKNCRHWTPLGGVTTAGFCRQNDNFLTLDLMHCSAFTYRPDADDWSQDDIRKSGFGNGGGGDDDGPADITPRDPFGPGRMVPSLPYRGFAGNPYPNNSGRDTPPLTITYDPDGDKKD